MKPSRDRKTVMKKSPKATAPETLPPFFPPKDKPTEQTKQPKPFVNFEERERNRQLPTDRVLELLKSSMPRQFELAEVVGKWIWIQFPEVPAEKIRADRSQLGFHWNTKRQAWQHPCGQITAGSPKEPREKYSSYFPADSQRAA